MRTRQRDERDRMDPVPIRRSTWGALLGISGAAGLGLLLALLGLWALWRARERQLAVWLAAWAFGPFVLALVISLARPVFVDRYLVVAAPAFAMLAAVAVIVARGSLGRRRPWPRGHDCRARPLVPDDDHGNWRGEDWRSAVAYVGPEREADVVVVPWWTHDAAEYYGAPADTSTADSIWVLPGPRTADSAPIGARSASATTARREPVRLAGQRAALAAAASP